MAEKCKKAKNVCKSDFEKNRRKRMLRHIKSNPFDRNARDIFVRVTGKSLGTMGDIPLELSSKGRKIVKRAHVKAQLRYQRNAARLARLEAIRQRALARETIEQQIIADGISA
jgi:hypothetical protein